MIRTALLAAALAACGGSKSQTIENSGAKAEPGILPGAYPCAFVSEGTTYGPYRCTVTGNHIDKPDGMEAWSGTLTPVQGGVHLDARRRCTQGDCSATSSFTVDLSKTPGTEIYRGTVAGAADWWLSSATLEIRSAGMGGDQYGGAMGLAGK